MAAFCRERGLCATHFFAWKKRLREAAAGREGLGASLPKFVEVQLIASGRGQAGRTREPSAARVPGAAGDQRVEVLLKSGRSLRAGPGVDAALVRELVAVVESAA